MENSKQELLVQSLVTLPGATVAQDLGLFNGELVVIRKLLSRYNPAGERGGGGSRLMCTKYLIFDSGQD